MNHDGLRRGSFPFRAQSVALESIDDRIGYFDRRSLPPRDGAVVETKPTALDGGFRPLNVVKGITANANAGLTGRGDLTADLVVSSGSATCEILAGDDSRPVQLGKSSV
jgi:hypothetical protein